MPPARMRWSRSTISSGGPISAPSSVASRVSLYCSIVDWGPPPSRMRDRREMPLNSRARC